MKIAELTQTRQNLWHELATFYLKYCELHNTNSTTILCTYTSFDIFAFQFIVKTFRISNYLLNIDNFSGLFIDTVMRIYLTFLIIFIFLESFNNLILFRPIFIFNLYSYLLVFHE